MDITQHQRETAQEISPSKTTVRWREALLFSLLAYGLSWTWWGTKIIPHLGQLLSAGRTPTNPSAIFGSSLTLDVGIGMLGPLFAAVIMRLFVSKEGLKGSLGLLRSWKYYLFALLAPAVFVSAVVLFNSLTGLGPFHWSSKTPLWLAYPQLVVITLLTSFVFPFPFCEEYGWRGYLLPRLLPLGEVKASLIVGMIWAGWHVPWLIAGVNFPGQNLWLALLVFFFSTVAVSLVFTRFYLVAGGSVLVVGLLHASFDTFGDTLTAPKVIPTGNPLIVDVTGLTSAVFLLIVMLIVYGVFKRSTKVEDPERFIHPRGDGTWRDWLR
jgi:membrane protease YdiL (CAAX protease family)